MELSKSVKILLIVGAILIAAVVVYLVLPEGEEAAPTRGVDRSALLDEASEE